MMFVDGYLGVAWLVRLGVWFSLLVDVYFGLVGFGLVVRFFLDGFFVVSFCCLFGLLDWWFCCCCVFFLFIGSVV